jgi:hypothetical protein
LFIKVKEKGKKSGSAPPKKAPPKTGTFETPPVKLNPRNRREPLAPSRFDLRLCCALRFIFRNVGDAIVIQNRKSLVGLGWRH